LTGAGYKRGKGTTIKTFSWPLDSLEVLRKAEELSGSRGLSTVIQDLLTDWVNQQQSVIHDNPIGLRYNSAAASATRHWIDSILEKPLDKLKQDISKVEDLELLKISIVSLKINETANNRSEVLRQIRSGRVIGVNGSSSMRRVIY
jgi:hypothetical protein